MQRFLFLWAGQLVSTVGSAMTIFAFTIWVWQQTESATALALFGFCASLSRMAITPFVGILVDRWNRKYLMIGGDLCSALCTLIIGGLYFTQNLEVWHLYVAQAVHGAAGHIQTLAYSASVTLLVPKEHYTRASSLGSIVEYSSLILAPALAGLLYPRIGLSGMIGIDVVSFAAAIAPLLLLSIPQPSQTSMTTPTPETLWQTVTFGFRYIWTHPSLLALTVAFSLFWFPNEIGTAIYNPMILARSDSSTEVLGSVMTAAGIGGFVGAVALSTWGGFKRRIHGMLIGFILIGLGQLVLGLSSHPPVWIAAEFMASLPMPLVFSSTNAIWYAKVAPEFQGRVFAADHLIGLVISAIASLSAGLLADYVFEPAAQPGGILAPLIGSEPGDGMAFLFVLTALLTIAVGIGGYAVRPLRDAEIRLPDHDATRQTAKL